MAPMASSDKNMLDDTFRILIATDIHLGFAEKDSSRGKDSFTTFEEILSIAKEKAVDMIILGGDLFHENKPSPTCIEKCMSLMRHYCMGDRPVPIEFLSDQAINFQNGVVNYEDANLNISIPIFSIHGNHDDPCGTDRVSSLDILSASGLVNYFGFWRDLKEVNIKPLLMRKGETFLALYGLSHIPDDRLSRLFRSEMVNFFRPSEEKDSWFNMFVLHQNRANRGINNYIEESMIPPFFDLVMWGHEHECLIEPVRSSTDSFFITQPGSPVATSLCEGEAVRKQVGLLQINKKKFLLKPIPLKTVRPFVMDTITLSKCRLNMAARNVTEEVQKYVADYVQTLIEKAEKQITGDPKQPDLPLIRLRVEYEHELQAFNTVRFGEKFCDKVANSNKLILLRREQKKAPKGENSVLDMDAMDDVLRREPVALMWENRMDSVLEEYFKNTSQSGLQVLSVKGLSQASSRFITKDDKEAIPDIVKHQVEKTLKYLEQNSVRDEDIAKAIETYRTVRQAKEEEEVNDALQVLENKDRLQKLLSQRADNFEDSIENGSDGSDCEVLSESVGRGRGRGGVRGRGAASTRSRASAPQRARGRRARGAAMKF